jgi:hypothetical protein
LEFFHSYFLGFIQALTGILYLLVAIEDFLDINDRNLLGMRKGNEEKERADGKNETVFGHCGLFCLVEDNLKTGSSGKMKLGRSAGI